MCVVAVSGGVDSAMTALLCQTAAESGVYSAVHALHMRNWDEIEERGVCSGERDAKDARRLCAALGLPYTEVDFSREYYLDVFQPLLDEYAWGNTPSPDVLCNRVIKFQLLLKHVQAQFGADAVLATGHYARIWHGGATAEGASASAAAPSPQLFVALDPRKDQSYFLSSVPASALRSCVFPLGQFRKAFLKNTLAKSEWVESRMKERKGNESAPSVLLPDRMAELRAAVDAFSLTPSAPPAADATVHPSRMPPPSSASPLRALSAKKESMGICFIGKRSLSSFLSDYLVLHRGVFVDIDSGRELAAHDSWETYTVGQKANISGMQNKMYVCAKHEDQAQRFGEPPLTVLPLPPPPRAKAKEVRDERGRRIRPSKPAPPLPRPPAPYSIFVCASKAHPALWFDELYLQELQWISEAEPAELAKEGASSMRVSVKIRSGQEQHPAMIVKLAPASSSSTAAPMFRVEFATPQSSVAAGQSCVVYDVSGRRCLGQGRIERAGPSYFQMGKELPSEILQSLPARAEL